MEDTIMQLCMQMNNFQEKIIPVIIITLKANKLKTTLRQESIQIKLIL